MEDNAKLTLGMNVWCPMMDWCPINSLVFLPRSQSSQDRLWLHHILDKKC